MRLSAYVCVCVSTQQFADSSLYVLFLLLFYFSFTFFKDHFPTLHVYIYFKNSFIKQKDCQHVCVYVCVCV